MAMATRRPASAVLLLLAALLAGRDGGRTSSAFVAPSSPVVRPRHTALAASPFPQGTSSSAPDVVSDFFNSRPTIDTSNVPPDLRTLLTCLAGLKSGSDLRGTYLDHRSSGMTILNLSRPIKRLNAASGGVALTPFAGHCFGAAFARWLLANGQGGRDGEALTVCIGRDPRPHGERLADAFSRGAQSAGGDRPVRVLYANVATTPSMYEFVR